MRTISDLTPAQQQLAREVDAEAERSREPRGDVLALMDADRDDKRALAAFWWGPRAMDEVAL